MNRTRPVQMPIAGATSLLVLGLASLATASGPLLWDNGEPDGSNGYSNATSGVSGARRTLLDDFVIELPGVAWHITDLRHLAVWNTLPPGSGVGMEIAFRADAGGTPGDVVAVANVTSYAEEATGRTMFGRPEYEAWTTFDGVTLPPGTYWLEATVIGPENNFWLVRSHERVEECWINFEDLGGLRLLRS